jgi:hypothetical protein
MSIDHRRRAMPAPRQRKQVPAPNELSVLDLSRRRCAMCFHLNGDHSEKHGQIAHLDQNPANFAEDNLAFLCLPHHSVFDSKTSQHKNYTLPEVKKARNDLYLFIQQNLHLAPPSGQTKWTNADRRTLEELIGVLHEAIFFLRKFSFNGTSFPTPMADPISKFLHTCREPEFEFVDGYLEATRKALIERLDRLSRLVDKVSRPVPNQDGWRRIPVELLAENPMMYEKMAGRFDSAAKQVCDLYDLLVREARRRLEV